MMKALIVLLLLAVSGCGANRVFVRGDTCEKTSVRDVLECDEL